MHPAMVAEIAADQIRDMRVTAARDQRARLARQGRGPRTGPLPPVPLRTWSRPPRTATQLAS